MGKQTSAQTNANGRTFLCISCRKAVPQATDLKGVALCCDDCNDTFYKDQAALDRLISWKQECYKRFKDVTVSYTEKVFTVSITYLTLLFLVIGWMVNALLQPKNSKWVLTLQGMLGNTDIVKLALFFVLVNLVIATFIAFVSYLLSMSYLSIRTLEQEIAEILAKRRLEIVFPGLSVRWVSFGLVLLSASLPIATSLIMLWCVRPVAWAWPFFWIDIVLALCVFLSITRIILHSKKKFYESGYLLYSVRIDG